ncbi:stage II sporulation protein P [Paenibacillus yanchengensis]|uniref:Stage II sporulation protein P n=1 Tax=Paenibacillus yanchengensis TaxID=2035833 RepID=A0ABW4YKE8_9BACL
MQKTIHPYTRSNQKMDKVMMSARLFSKLSIISMLLFIFFGVTSIVYKQSNQGPNVNLRQLAATVSNGLFGDMLEIELPQFHSQLTDGSINNYEISRYLMKALTNIDIEDPTSIIISELPGMQQKEVFLLRKGIATDITVGPQDYTPVDYDPSIEFAPGGEEPPTGNDVTPIIDEQEKTDLANKSVFIYHTHNRESWYPEMEEKKKYADSTTKNITLLGKRLKEQLESKGIGAIHSKVDYPATVPDFRYNLSYKYSKKTVKEAIASSKELIYFFDIHRDSQKRKYTTVNINGEDYAQIYFIIGHKNPNWKENEALANEIHDALEKKYPGISRGVWGKTAANGNAEYNQSLAAGNLLIEIGGIENTLEESYRTADALAEVVSKIYWADETVSTKE